MIHLVPVPGLDEPRPVHAQPQVQSLHLVPVAGIDRPLSPVRLIPLCRRLLGLPARAPRRSVRAANALVAELDLLGPDAPSAERVAVVLEHANAFREAPDRVSQSTRASRIARP
jgi:hypothetical protein